MFHRLLLSFIALLPKAMVWPFAKKYVAGVNAQQGMLTSLQLNKEGLLITADLLGEFIENLDEGKKSTQDYLQLIELFESNQVGGNYSLKPSFFGLLIDPEQCYQNIRQVVQQAAKYNNFVRIDMEDSPCTSLEIEIYRRLKKEFPKQVGLVLQAYMRRTYDDIESLLDLHSEEAPLNFRLCKGIYIEEESIAYKGYQEVRDNYLKLLEFLFEKKIYVGIATHDPYLVEGAFALIEKLQVSPKLFEFQMLYGVSPELRKRILQKQYKMRVYVPFGEHWYGYSMRRLKENPKIFKEIIKSLFIRS